MYMCETVTYLINCFVISVAASQQSQNIACIMRKQVHIDFSCVFLVFNEWFRGWVVRSINPYLIGLFQS